MVAWLVELMAADAVVSFDAVCDSEDADCGRGVVLCLLTWSVKISIIRQKMMET